MRLAASLVSLALLALAHASHAQAPNCADPAMVDSPPCYPANQVGIRVGPQTKPLQDAYDDGDLGGTPGPPADPTVGADGAIQASDGLGGHKDSGSTEGDLTANTSHRGTTTGNPHAVTAGEVGAEPAGSVATHASDANAHHTPVDLITDLSDVVAVIGTSQVHINHSGGPGADQVLPVYDANGNLTSSGIPVHSDANAILADLTSDASAGAIGLDNPIPFDNSVSFGPGAPTLGAGGVVTIQADGEYRLSGVIGANMGTTDCISTIFEVNGVERGKRSISYRGSGGNGDILAQPLAEALAILSAGDTVELTIDTVGCPGGSLGGTILALNTWLSVMEEDIGSGGQQGPDPDIIEMCPGVMLDTTPADPRQGEQFWFSDFGGDTMEIDAPPIEANAETVVPATTSLTATTANVDLDLVLATYKNGQPSSVEWVESNDGFRLCNSQTDSRNVRASIAGTVELLTGTTANVTLILTIGGSIAGVAGPADEASRPYTIAVSQGQPMPFVLNWHDNVGGGENCVALRASSDVTEDYRFAANVEVTAAHYRDLPSTRSNQAGWDLEPNPLGGAKPYAAMVGQGGVTPVASSRGILFSQGGADFGWTASYPAERILPLDDQVYAFGARLAMANAATGQMFVGVGTRTGGGWAGIYGPGAALLLADGYGVEILPGGAADVLSFRTGAPAGEQRQPSGQTILVPNTNPQAFDTRTNYVEVCGVMTAGALASGNGEVELFWRTAEQEPFGAWTSLGSIVGGAPYLGLFGVGLRPIVGNWGSDMWVDYFWHYRSSRTN